MNEAIFNGDDDILLVWDGTVYRPIACITSSGMEEGRTFRERLTKCSNGATERSPGAYNASIPVEGLVFDTTSVGGDTAKASYDWLQQKIRAAELLTIKNTLGTLAPEYAFVYIENLVRTSPANEDISFTANFLVQGVPVSEDPHEV